MNSFGSALARSFIAALVAAIASGGVVWGSLYAFDAKPFVLWTDALIYLLVFVIALFALYARAHEHLRAPWRQVKRRRLGMMSLVVLLAYVVIGLADSIHFKVAIEKEGDPTQKVYSGDSLSVLDIIATPLRERVEKTYSAPFATHLYVKETIERPDGTQTRDYPRLKFGGAHLDDPADDRPGDIAARALGGVIAGLVVVAIATLALAAGLARRERVPLNTMLRRMLHGETETPWHVVLLTVTVIVVIAAVCVQLAPAYHIFGTDKVGQDVFYQALKSVRTGLVIGTLTTLIMLPFAVLLGVMAGYFGGWADDVIQYLYTTLNSIPGVLLIAAAVLLLQVYLQMQGDQLDTVQRADIRLLFLCMILGITSWTGLCRLLRGEALKLRELDYIQSAVALGVGRFTIIGRHIVPNVMHIVLIAVVLDFSGLVLAEAVLSYVGVGVDPTMDSWGNMINQARLEMAREPMVWWSLLAAFVFMFILVLAANLFSDAVRDAFDPRLRERV
jgi:peptide/nickel transport system permease protein